MATVEALGRIPVGTPVDHIITDLAATQAKQQRNVQIAQLACPTLSTAASSGSYPKEDGWFGLDESDMSVKTDASVTGEDYPEMQIGATSQAFRVERDLIGSIKIADRTVADWSATTGQDYSAYAAQKAERIARDHFVKKAFALVGTSGGYDVDNTRDPGDITSSTFDFAEEIAYDAVERLLDKNTYADGDPLLVLISWDVVPSLMKLQQLRSRIGSTTGVASGEAAGSVVTTVLNMDEVEAAVASLFPDNTTVRIVRGKYKSSAGTATDFLSAKIAVLANGGPGSVSFARCVTQDGFNPILETRTERFESFRGYRVYVDSYSDFLVENDAAGVLYTGLLS